MHDFLLALHQTAHCKVSCWSFMSFLQEKHGQAWTHIT